MTQPSINPDPESPYPPQTVYERKQEAQAVVLEKLKTTIPLINIILIVNLVIIGVAVLVSTLGMVLLIAAAAAAA